MTYPSHNQVKRTCGGHREVGVLLTHLNKNGVAACGLTRPESGKKPPALETNKFLVTCRRCIQLDNTQTVKGMT